MFVNLLKSFLESVPHIKPLKIGFMLMKTFLNLIKNLFDLDDYDKAKKELQSLIFRENNKTPPFMKSLEIHLSHKRYKIKKPFKKQCQN